MVTLGMLTALRGVTEVIMGGQWITDLPPELRSLGTGTWLGIPICLWVTAAVVLISLWLIHRSTLGRRIYAIGSHPKAARLAGLPIARTQCLVFAWTGFLTAVATLVSVPQLSVVDAGIGVGMELLVVTCVVVGGTAVSGGIGNLVAFSWGLAHDHDFHGAHLHEIGRERHLLVQSHPGSFHIGCNPSGTMDAFEKKTMKARLPSWLVTPKACSLG